MGDWRSTLISAIAVPVSLIGTFFFMQFLGINLNMITLFALVLAIGIAAESPFQYLPKWQKINYPGDLVSIGRR